MPSKNHTRYIKGAIPNRYFKETSPLLVQPDRLILKVAFLKRPTGLPCFAIYAMQSINISSCKS